MPPGFKRTWLPGGRRFYRGLLYQVIHLEERYGVGPDTISVPRIEPALNTPFTNHNKHHVSDEEFEKLITVVRLSVPYTDLILTARESAEIRKKMLPLGVTQIDAGSRIGIGGYKKTQTVISLKRNSF